MLLIQVCLLVSPRVFAANVVRVQLPASHQFLFAGYYAAHRQGYYARAGLDVRFQLPAADTDVVSAVVQGEAEFGVQDSRLILARLQGEPVVLLANLFKSSAAAWVTRSDIQSIAELAGRRVMIANGLLTAAPWRAQLADAGLTAAQLHLLPYQNAATALTSGTVDAVLGLQAHTVHTLEQQAFAYRTFSSASPLVDGMAGNLFTSSQFAHRQPDLVAAFTQATLKGWRYALAHPVQMVDLISKQYAPGLSRAALLAEAEAVERLTMRRLYAPGRVDPQQLEAVVDTYVRQYPAIDRTRLQGFVRPLQHPLALSQAERQWLARHPVIHVNGVLRSPMLDEAQTGYQGYLPDLLALAGQQLGVTFRLQTGAARQDSTMLETVDVVASSDAPGLPLLQQPLALAYRADFGTITELAALRGYRVGVVDNGNMVAALDRQFPEISTVRCRDIQTCMTRLATGNITAVLETEAVLAFNLGRYVIPGVRMSAALRASGIRMLDQRLVAHAPLLDSALRKALASLPREEHQALARRWFSKHGRVHSGRVMLTAWEQARLLALGRLRYCVGNIEQRPAAINTLTNQYVQLLNQYLNIELQPVAVRHDMPPVELLKAGGCELIAGFAPAHQAGSRAVFSAPFFHLPLVLMAPVPHANRVPALEAGQRYAVPAYLLAAGWLQARWPEVEVVAVPDLQAGIALVRAGAVRGLLGVQRDVPLLRQYAERLALKWTPLPGAGVPMMFTLSTDVPQLVGIVNKALAAVTYREHQNIRQHWLQVGAPGVAPVSGGWWISLVFSSAVVLVVLALRHYRRVSRTAAESSSGPVQPIDVQAYTHRDRDAQSGLYNRLKLNSALQQALQSAEVQGRSICLVLLDVDNLQQINNQYGRALGDSVLGDIAYLLAKDIAAPDLVGRWSSKQFLMLSETRPLEQCRRQAERLRQCIAEYEFDHGDDVTATIAIIASEPGRSPAMLVRHLEQTLLAAKQAGRNRVMAAHF